MSINGKVKWFNATKGFAVGLAGTASLLGLGSMIGPIFPIVIDTDNGF